MVLRKKGAEHKFTLANRTHLFVHFHVQAVRHLVVLKKKTTFIYCLAKKKIVTIFGM